MAWASNLDWGFEKHPPLSAFFAEFFYQVFGRQDWAYYLLSQIFVIFSFVVIFKLAKEFLKNEVNALLSVLLLEGIYFYNFTTPEFNVNICQIPIFYKLKFQPKILIRNGISALNPTYGG